MQKIGIQLFLISFFLCPFLSILAGDPQQDFDPQQYPDNYQLDLEVVRKKLHETPRYQDIPRVLNFLNFSYSKGFKPTAVYEYASSIFDATNTESKDAHPFAVTGEHSQSRTAYWCTFCDKKLKTVKAGTKKPDDIEDFVLLCGGPLTSEILRRNQSAQYREFLGVVAKTKKQYTS